MTPQEQERMLELACDRALVGLTPDGQDELEAFLGVAFDGRALDLEVAAPAVQLSQLGALEVMPRRAAGDAWKAAGAFFASRGETRVMPESTSSLPAPVALMRGPMLPALGSAPPMQAAPPAAQNVVPMRGAMPASASMPAAMPAAQQRAPVSAGSPVGGPSNLTAARPPRDVLRWAGWLAAAACFALAVAAFWPRLSAVAVAPSPSAEPSATSAVAARAALLAGAKDVVRAEWTAATDPTGRGVTGDVVWSGAEQRGYMRFHGLAVNDRAAVAYQLWIFDAKQDERYPVDGGVFDVDAATGDVVVPITAKLRVQKPTLFAVTVEKPGGVVVSKRDRLVVTAAITG